MFKSNPANKKSYEAVKAFLVKNPDSTISAACKSTGTAYHIYKYYSEKDSKPARTTRKRATKAKRSYNKPTPRMETVVVENTRKFGSVVAFVGSRSEVVASVRELMGLE